MSEVEVELIKQDVGCMASLKRISSPMQALATTITVTSVMTGVVPLTQLALGAGGPAVMVFGFALVCLLSLTIALSLADIASGFPNVKGGLIEYSRRLAPPHLKRISAWTVGWLHFFSFTMGATACAFSIAVFGAAGLQIATGVAPQRWVTVFIHIVVSALFGVFNAYSFDVDFISGTVNSTSAFVEITHND
ncbi:hypothetical protein BGZ58_006376 [Dissophora ornata]|nr:hypothetical protein BGZ58_006376 [Dissophora ornata]